MQAVYLSESSVPLISPGGRSINWSFVFPNIKSPFLVSDNDNEGYSIHWLSIGVLNCMQDQGHAEVLGF